ncbi:hypothetical protein YTPLAS21_16490 [Candidatus Nitrosocosmicus sp.]|nr:hypothetical protein YTPLAS21_16490 [Candidatus Nitrosocosmicus sp.]
MELVDSGLNYDIKSAYSLCKLDDALESSSFLKYPINPPIAYETEIMTRVKKRICS